ncbi:MAG: peptide ABC transporter permease, partial [Spirochaeta sp. LUC14_002_19_P3]
MKPIKNTLTAKRLRRFRQNKLGYFSAWTFLLLFVLSLFAEFIANDRPLIAVYRGKVHFPVIIDYPETAFGGDYSGQTDYRDPYVMNLIHSSGWTIWPPIRFSHSTINYGLKS